MTITGEEVMCNVQTNVHGPLLLLHTVVETFLFSNILLFVAFSRSERRNNIFKLCPSDIELSAQAYM